MTRNRRAFTIVELLVVITIIGMLMALLLPAVSNAVGAAQRIKCGQQMGQATLATNGFVMAKEQYPGHANALAGRTVPWTVMIIGHLDRQDIFDLWSDPAVADADLPRVAIEIFRCPSDPPELGGVPQLSIVGNGGASSAVAESPANGIFLDRSAGASAPLIRPAMIQGMATTLLLSENIQATEWPIAGKVDTCFLWHPTTTPLAEQRINQGVTLPLSESTARPSGYHTGGVNVSFCDGHVTFLDEQIDYKVYMQLMTPNGKESDMPAAWKTYVLNEGDF